MSVSGYVNEAVIWDYLYDFIENDYGVAGLIGNLYAESGLYPNNLQNQYNTQFGLTDKQYTDLVNSGERSESTFVNDNAGYGLAQWTYYSRKQILYDNTIKMGYQINDLDRQLYVLEYELKHSFPTVLETLRTATSIEVASDIVLEVFENPEDQSQDVHITRRGYCQNFYNVYANDEPNPPQPPDPPDPPQPIEDNILEILRSTAYNINQLTQEDINILELIKVGDIVEIKKPYNRNKRTFGYNFTNSRLTLVKNYYKILSVEKNGFLKLQFSNEKTYIYLNPKNIKGVIKP